MKRLAVVAAAAAAAAALVPSGHVRGQTPDMGVPALALRDGTAAPTDRDRRAAQPHGRAPVSPGHVQGLTPDMGVPALVARDGTTVLTHLDRRTLRPVRDSWVSVGRHDAPWSRSPDGRRAVIGSVRMPSLAFVGLRPLSGGRRVAVGPGAVVAVAWLAPRRVVAVVAGRCCPQPLRVLVLDPDRHGPPVVSRASAGRGLVLRARRSGRKLVLLVVGQARVRPARLVVVDASGRVRSRELPPIRAGDAQLRRGVTEYRTPGIAVSAERAYVVGGFKQVAVVDLRTLRVAYHRIVDRRLQDGGGLVIGETRIAVWLDGVLAVTGRDDRIVNGRQVTEPAGLSLIDPHDWSARMLDATIALVARAGRLVVGWGGADALRTFGSDGRQQLRLVRTPSGGGPRVVWPYAYLGLDDGWERPRVDVVDLRTGRLTSARITSPTTLLAGAERLSRYDP
jgi:hypothetical protein